MTSTQPRQTTTMKARLHERAAQLRGEIQHTLERSTDETHVRIAEQARDTEDDSFSNLIVDLNLAEIDRDADELRRIDSALARLSEGSYGFCEELRPAHSGSATARPSRRRFAASVSGALREDARVGVHAAAVKRTPVPKVTQVTQER